MQAVFDHLTAIVISIVIFGVLIAMQIRVQESQVDATRHYANRTHMVSFIDVLERDLHNLGAGVDPADPMIVDYSWSGSPKFIEFQTIVDTAATATAELIRYELVPTDTVDVGANGTIDMVPCYELRRFVYDPIGSQYQLDGKSQERLTDFEIELRDGSGSPIGANLNDTRMIQVRIAAISPLGADQIVQRSRWQTLFQPINLRLKDS